MKIFQILSKCKGTLLLTKFIRSSLIGFTRLWIFLKEMERIMNLKKLLDLLRQAGLKKNMNWLKGPRKKLLRNSAMIF